MRADDPNLPHLRLIAEALGDLRQQVVFVGGAVAFVATKLEAFAGRGGGDFLSSHDIEDVLNIVDGREELADEMAAAPADLRQAVGTAFSRLLSDPEFANVLPGMIAAPERASLVAQRMKAMCTHEPGT